MHPTSPAKTHSLNESHETQLDILQPDEALIFLHVMKTGGTSLFKILRQHFPEEVRFHYSEKPQKTLDYFNRLPQERRDRLRFLHGHFHLGFFDSRLQQSTRYITMLRHPLNRVISLYYFLHKNPNSRIPDTERCQTLQEYLGRRWVEVDNGQTRRIAGDSSHQIPFGECTPALLNMAKKNLDDFLMVGVTERFDESLIVLKHALNMERILYSRFNENSRKPKSEVLDSTDIEFINAHNQLDAELYRYANMLLDKKIAEIGDRFPIEYQFFQHANLQFSGAQARLEKTKSAVKRTKARLKYIQKKRKELRTILQHEKAELERLSNSKFWRLWNRLKHLKESRFNLSH